MRHGEDVGVEDAEPGVKGQNGVLALVVLAAAAVCFCEKACNTRGVTHGVVHTCQTKLVLFRRKPTQVSK